HLRDGALQRDRRAPRDPGLDHQRLRAAAEGGAQALPHARPHPPAQGQEPEHVPPAAGILHRAIFGKGRGADGGGGAGAVAVLAQGEQYEGGHVPERGGGHLRGHGPGRVCQGAGAAVQSVGEECRESAFP
ncbi:hypothetical protein LTR53_019893, partial [Teratosphaeriaceae sp. CCFEE 6253]